MAKAGTEDNAFQAQTNELFDYISGKRSSRKMEQDARAVLENLRGHRDQGIPSTPLTELFLQRAAQGVPPDQLVAETRAATVLYARTNPQGYVDNIIRAVNAGLLTPPHAITLLMITNHPLLTEARARFANEARASENAQQERLLDDWAARERDLLERRMGLRHRRQEEPEPEPEPESSSVFNTFAGARQAPRRILKKLKRTQGRKEATDGHNHQP